MKRLLIAALLALASPATAFEPTPQDIRCLATVIKHEAGGEPKQGQIAVGYVVLNRVHSPKWPKTICDVVYQRGQFTDIRRAKAAPQFTALAESIIRTYDAINDPTNGSYWFHNARAHPWWPHAKRTTRIGFHTFYTVK